MLPMLPTMRNPEEGGVLAALQWQRLGLPPVADAAQAAIAAQIFGRRWLPTSYAVRQTGDVGTALVTLGLMAGTPTTKAANLTTGPIPAAVGLTANAMVNGTTYFLAFVSSAGLVYTDSTHCSFAFSSSPASSALTLPSSTVVGTFTVGNNSASGATVNNLVFLAANSVAGASDGFGWTVSFFLKSSTTANQGAGSLDVLWATAAHASRSSRVVLKAQDSVGKVEGWRVEADGSGNPMIGFLGASAVALQDVSGTRTGTLGDLQTVVGNLLTALVNFGLITDSTT